MIVDIVVEALAALSQRGARRCSCAIAGESGAGKTLVTAYVAQSLADRGLPTAVLHQDDYFRLPPHENHQRRVADRDWVGPTEVWLDRLEQHVLAYHASADSLSVPELARERDRFEQRRVELDGVKVLLVEGTYAMRVTSAELRLFIDRDFRSTELGRRRRARELIDEHTDAILGIEHRILQDDRLRADAYLGSDAMEELERAIGFDA
jgi:uridine kinase